MAGSETLGKSFNLPVPPVLFWKIEVPYLSCGVVKRTQWVQAHIGFGPHLTAVSTFQLALKAKRRGLCPKKGQRTQPHCHATSLYWLFTLKMRTQKERATTVSFPFSLSLLISKMRAESIGKTSVYGEVKLGNKSLMQHFHCSGRDELEMHVHLWNTNYVTLEVPHRSSVCI